MSYIIDRILLIALSVIALVIEGDTANIIIIGLTAVIIAGICYYFGMRRVTAFAGGFYMLGCIFIPKLLCIIPVLIYEMYGVGCYAELLILGIIFLFGTVSFSFVSIAIIAVAGVLACVLYSKTSLNERLIHTARSIRDDSEEKNMLLKEKNRNLIEKQDSEIYVATLKERNRIAREIHDNVGHIITRSILQMGALMTIHKEEPLNEQLTSVKNNLDIAINNIRGSVHDLHDESIDLRQAISDIADSLYDRFFCNLEYDITEKVDRSYKYAIIGIVKEAVSNIIKHSRNDRVDIILREHPGIYQIVIHDYGADCQSVPERKTIEELTGGSGIGIRNIQDRVDGLNGNMSVNTENGFRIFVSLPKKEKHLQ